MSAPDGGPAFPVEAMTDTPTQCGMSLRDWFAGQALAGLLAGAVVPPDVAGEGAFLPAASDLAPEAYRYADALLEARKR